MNPEQWLSLKWNGGSTMSDRWLNQSKIIHWRKKGFPLGTVREGDWDIFTYVPWEHKLPFFTLIPREAKYLL